MKANGSSIYKLGNSALELPLYLWLGCYVQKSGETFICWSHSYSICMLWDFTAFRARVVRMFLNFILFVGVQMTFLSYLQLRIYVAVKIRGTSENEECTIRNHFWGFGFVFCSATHKYAVWGGKEQTDQIILKSSVSLQSVTLQSSALCPTYGPVSVANIDRLDVPFLLDRSIPHGWYLLCSKWDLVSWECVVHLHTDNQNCI